LNQGDISNHIVDGDLASIGIKGLFGAKTFFGSDGQLIGHTEPNTLGGKDVWDGTHLVSKTIPTQDGYTDLIHPENSVEFTHVGNTTTAMTADGHHFVIQDLGHGFHTVMNFADPLMHIGEYSMPGLKF
jgi:hypothetical protein